MMPTNLNSHSGELTLESILSAENGRRAFEKVRSNRGCPGVDAIPLSELEEVFPAQWENVRNAILTGTYRPQPLRRVEIPKPAGGIRKLGIPSVMDRVVQQSIAQALSPWFEPRFSPLSFAYRPGKKPHDAIATFQQLLAGARLRRRASPRYPRLLRHRSARAATGVVGARTVRPPTRGSGGARAPKRRL